MIKRPLSPQFADLVKQGRKTTTIRRTAWPMGVPIMLYRWEGKAFRSKQVNVAIIRVVDLCAIKITRRTDGKMMFDPAQWRASLLWATEGFESPEAMDAWFREKIAPGKTVQMVLMDFVVVDVPADIADLLAGLALQMDDVAMQMEYYGGFDAEMVQHAAELRGAADLVSAWGREIEGGKLL